eukprot:scaffold3039_cov194-Pinguiococcus_pyrenoidosus.AAC.1
MLAPHYAGALFDALAENEEQVRLRRMLRHGRAKRLSDAMQVRQGKDSGRLDASQPQKLRHGKVSWLAFCLFLASLVI